MPRSARTSRPSGCQKSIIGLFQGLLRLCDCLQPAFDAVGMVLQAALRVVEIPEAILQVSFLIVRMPRLEGVGMMSGATKNAGFPFDEPVCILSQARLYRDPGQLATDRLFRSLHFCDGGHIGIIHRLLRQSIRKPRGEGYRELNPKVQQFLSETVKPLLARQPLLFILCHDSLQPYLVLVKETQRKASVIRQYRCLMAHDFRLQLCYATMLFLYLRLARFHPRLSGSDPFVQAFDILRQ